MRILGISTGLLGALVFMTSGAAAQSTAACQAIYTEARDTKSCIAYEAFAQSCGSHPLLPVAKLFLEKECGGTSSVTSNFTAGRPVAPLHDCDRLAAHKDDPDKVGDGISFKDIDVRRAKDACHHAIGRYSREPRFRYQLGRVYDKAKDYDNAAHGYATASEMGHARAMAAMGTLYRNGDGRPVDEQQAFEWDLKAAKAGYASSMHLVGTEYLMGDFVKQDDEEAFRWQLKSAQGGHVKGMIAVARYYLDGAGTPQDLVASRKWYKVAAGRGNGFAMQMYADLLDAGHGGARDPKEAARYLLFALSNCSSVVVENLTGNYGWFEADTIDEVQRGLQKWDVYSGSLHGKLDRETAAAIRKVCPKKG
jgi:hypothetical protein